jgi:hypothetical protein
LNPSALRRLADGFNHLLTVQKRQLFGYSQDWNASTSGSGSILTLWPVAFRTSRGTTGIVVSVGLVKTDVSFGSGSPLMQLQVQTLTGGVNVASASLYFNQRSSGATVVPDDVNWQITVLEGLDPDTEYKMLMRVTDGARPISIAIWERQAGGPSAFVEGIPASYTVDDTDDDVCNPGQFESEGDILDSGIQKMVTASNDMLKHSRTHLLSHTSTPYQQISASGLTITGSTTYVRVIGRTFHIDTTKLTTLRRSGLSTAVPVRLAACSDRTAGTGTLSIGLYDLDAAAIVAEVTGIADDGVNNWSVASDFIPAQDGRYEIHAKQSNGTTTHILYGVSMWPYEA